MMELALLLDPRVASPAPEWAAFGSAAIAKWQTCNAEGHREWVPTGGQKSIDGRVPARPERPRPRQSRKGADPHWFGNLGQFSALEPSAAAFGTFSKPEPDGPGGGDFPKSDEPKADDSGFGDFPKFEEPKTDDGDAGCGSFPRFDEPKVDRPNFQGQGPG
jgi:hypothetical protein